MEDILRVEILYSLAELEKTCWGLIFFELFLNLDLFIEWPFLHVLHYDVEMELVMEKAIHLDYVGMIREEIYFQLHDKLVKHQPDIFFLDLFDGH